MSREGWDTEQLPFLPMPLERVKDLETVLCLTSHRHLARLAKAKAALRKDHGIIHMLEPLTEDSDIWEEKHQECLDDMAQMSEWFDRGQAAIWS